MFAFQNIGNSVFDNILRVARDHDQKVEEVKETNAAWWGFDRNEGTMGWWYMVIMVITLILTGL